MLTKITEYLTYRNNILVNYVEPHLMNEQEAEKSFNQLIEKHYSKEECFLSPQPMNKQKGDKKKKAFFTCAINLLTEHAIKQFNLKNSCHITCDYDPRHLTFLTKSNNHNKTYITNTYSRRFDGAIPTLKNPVAIWEIKEYYYTSTFGSRIADGIYETQLDGYEIKHTTNEKPLHYFMIDGHSAWWEQGKSYLCRIIDILNMGLVNEVIFGNEIYDIWENRIKQICQYYIDRKVKQSNDKNN